jgi:signal transduction histidine kinase
MNLPITRIEIRYEQDVVYVRQRARLIAELLGLGRQDQTRLSTAVSEIARNAFQYARGGEAIFAVTEAADAQRLSVTVRDQGPGIGVLAEILAGRYTSRTGMGIGLSGARRLVDDLTVETAVGAGTTVQLSMTLPSDAPRATSELLRSVAERLAATVAESPLEEIRTQNAELCLALDALRERDGTLTRLNDELKAFAYTVSHDLKAPLRGIAGYANELEKKHTEGLSARARFCLEQILVATNNLDCLIEDLLHYSRLDAETRSLASMNLAAVVDMILQDRALVIAERGIAVTVDVSVAPFAAWQRGIVQVLTNLIDNAIKYSRQSTPPRVAIHARSEGAVVRIAVTDNGIGFDMKYHDRIFGLFNRLVRAEEYEGTGAGLAIAKKLVDKHGGRIWAESRPGDGATFFVELPILSQAS